jgi:hypothetical protein
MASELHVDSIKHSGGTSALTIDSAGTIDFSVNNNVSIFGLTTQQTINSSSLATLTGWSVINNQTTHGFKTVGSSINENSGVFKPTKLGLYRVDADFNIYNHLNSNGVRWIEIDLAFTPNGQSEIGGDVYNNLGYFQSDTTYTLGNRTRFYNFNHANDSLRIRIAGNASFVIKASGATDFDTQIMFTWLAPPQT